MSRHNKIEKLPVDQQILFRLAHVKGVNEDVLKRVGKLLCELDEKTVQEIAEADRFWFDRRNIIYAIHTDDIGNKYEAEKVFNAVMLGYVDTEDDKKPVYLAKEPATIVLLKAVDKATLKAPTTVAFFIVPKEGEEPVMLKMLKTVIEQIKQKQETEAETDAQ